MENQTIDPKQETLLNKCLNELIKRKIDFCICFCHVGGGYIENSPHDYERTFCINFDSDDTFTSFNDHDGIKKITTIEELLKLRPFY